VGHLYILRIRPSLTQTIGSKTKWKTEKIGIHINYMQLPNKIDMDICSSTLPKKIVSGEGLPRNWMILLGHRRLQYIGEEPLGVAGG
jgi:hypothetical protein